MEQRGLLALFGLQLLAVFGNRFGEDLGSPQQALHLLAMGLVVVGVVLEMAPLAYRHYAAMVPLGAALTIDFYLAASVILGDSTRAGILAVLLAAFIVVAWAVLPNFGWSRRAPPQIDATP